MNESPINKPSPSKTSDRVAEAVIKVLALFSVLMIVFIFVFVVARAWPVLSAAGIGLFVNDGFDAQIGEAFADPAMMNFGLFGLIAGTLVSTAAALLVAAVIGVGCAVAIKEFTPRPVSAALTAAVRLLAGIPSVVFGLIGMITVVPWVQSHLVTPDLQLKWLAFFQISGRGLLAGIVVLTFMLVPTVTAMSADAVAAVPRKYREAGYAVGMSRFRVIWKIVLPTAGSGITASVILAAGRGIGEAIAVSMVCGGVGVTPDFTRGAAAFLAPVLPLSAAIINKSEAMGGAAVNAALFACAAILLAIGAALSVAARLVARHMRRSVGYED